MLNRKLNLLACSLFIATHANILAFDTSRIFHKKPSKVKQNIPLPQLPV